MYILKSGRGCPRLWQWYRRSMSIPASDSGRKTWKYEQAACESPTCAELLLNWHQKSAKLQWLKVWSNSWKLTTHLHQPTIISCHDEFSITTYMATTCDVLEPRDSFCYFLCSRGVDLHSGCHCYCITVWFCSRKMYGGYRCIFFDKDRVLILAPVSWLCCVFFAYWTSMPFDGGR